MRYRQDVRYVLAPCCWAPHVINWGIMWCPGLHLYAINERWEIYGACKTLRSTSWGVVMCPLCPVHKIRSCSNHHNNNIAVAILTVLIYQFGSLLSTNIAFSDFYFCIDWRSLEMTLFLRHCATCVSFLPRLIKWFRQYIFGPISI